MTIKEVAELAGVSPAAVSRYMNGGPLSEEKKEAIQKVIEETGYRPSLAGQVLRTGKMNQIGVIVPKINSEAVSKETAGIAKKLEGTPYRMVLGVCALDTEKELEYLRAMDENNVAGIILMGTIFTPEHEQIFKEKKIPVVVTGQDFPNTSCVFNDDFGAAKDLTEHMINSGRRKLGYIGVSEDDIAVGVERRRGFLEAVKAEGLDPDTMPYFKGNFTVADGAEAVTKVLETNPDIDGLICATDDMALGAMKQLKILGKRIPEDIGIAGFDNSWAGVITEPQLSTVNLYHINSGEEAAAMLLELMDQPEAPVKKIKLNYKIIERDSF